jgi:two-component sensor histidine kinase
LESQLQKEIEEGKIQELSRQIQVRNLQYKYLLLIIFLSVALITLLLFTNRDRRIKNKAISKSLDEKEVLIKEIHHRVKNNLQIVSSILSLQSRNIEDQETKEAIVDSRDRVKSMALVHQKLYQENNLKGVMMKGYLENLISSLSHSYGFSEKGIAVNLDVDPMILDIDTTIPIGLITNELITNALKYAFPNNSLGEILIRLKDKKNHLLLEVTDNGKIIKDSSQLKEGFGFQLIRSLGRKLKAEPIIEVKNGLCVSLVINNFKKIVQ